ncbi:MAG: sugar phosphate isomerase/epimerase [Betaproteobacteria bacterium]|nr:sugar phosphate isomerase/epimerase [Betaproteobacteria bacterium]
MTYKIGFMQGRLSPLVNGRIQAFPWDDWRAEFPAAAKIGLNRMEWTLDQERLYENPLMTPSGQEEIRGLCRQHGFAIPSLTGDCFMQAPFWKANGQACADLQRDFLAIGRACAQAGIRMMVVPLVDNGRLDTPEQEDLLVSFLLEQRPFLTQHGLEVIFESDYSPAELARFIARLPADWFGINYDIGNSAALGFDPAEEFAAYGERIVNVHVKDRLLGGTTVPLGTGNADFDTVFSALAKAGYAGNYIMQTARAGDGDHAGALTQYRQLIEGWIDRHRAHAA